MKKTEHIRKSGKYYPDKPFDPYNRYPYESVKEVRDWYGDFVESTEGYAYFIVWINSVPSNRCKVLLFADKKEINQYKTNDHRGGEFDDWYHFGNSTKYLPINGKSAEELNNYIRHFRKNMNGLSGSVGATYCLTDQMHLRLNLARGFRAPNLSELGSNGVHEGSLRYELGNQQLKPEDSWQLDAGIDYSSHIVTAQLSLFVNHISNFIFLQRMDEGERLKDERLEMNDEGFPVYQYAAGTARLWGGHGGGSPHAQATHRKHICLRGNTPAAPTRRQSLSADDTTAPLDGHHQVRPAAPMPPLKQLIRLDWTGVLPAPAPYLCRQRHRNSNSKLHIAERCRRYRRDAPRAKAAVGLPDGQQPARQGIPKPSQPTEIC